MGSRSALALATAGNAIGVAGWTLVGALGPQMRESFGLTHFQTGLLVILPLLVGCIAKIPAGLLADRRGGRRVFVALLALAVLPATLLGYARGYLEVAFLAAWLGLAGATFAAGVPFVLAWYPARLHGLVLGIYGLGSGGAALATWLVPVAAEAWGWRAVFLVASAGFLVMAALLWLGARDAAPAAGGPVWTHLGRIAAHPGVWVLAVYALVTEGGLLALSFHLPTMLVRIYGLSPASAGAHGAWFLGLAMVGRLMGGWFADRFEASRIASLLFPPIAVSSGLLALGPPHGQAVAILLALGAVLGAGIGALFKLVAAEFPDDTGTVSGLLGAVAALGGAALPLIQGYFMDLIGSYVFGYVALGSLALIALAITGILRRGR